MLAPGFWLSLGLSEIVALMLRSSLLGRYAYAIGSNAEATARLCGIGVWRVKLAVYGSGRGCLTGLAGRLQFLVPGRDRRPDHRGRAGTPGDCGRGDRRREPQRWRGDCKSWAPLIGWPDHVRAE